MNRLLAITTTMQATQPIKIIDFLSICPSTGNCNLIASLPANQTLRELHERNKMKMSKILHILKK